MAFFASLTLSLPPMMQAICFFVAPGTFMPSIAHGPTIWATLKAVSYFSEGRVFIFRLVQKQSSSLQYD